MNTDASTSQAPPGDPAGGEHWRERFKRLWILVFLVSLVFQPALDSTATTADWVVAAVLIVVGGWLVIVSYRATGRRHTAVAAAFAVLGVTTVWFNANATVFFIYAAGTAGAFASRARARRWFIWLTVALLVLAGVSTVPMPYRIAAFAFPTALVWVIGYAVLDDVERNREASRLRIDNVRIERLATLGERERIARDLHDLLGHTLTSIVVRAQLIAKVAETDPAAAVREAADIEQTARTALSEVRAAVTGWRHHALDAELDIARDVLAAADVDLRVEQEAEVAMSPQVEAAVALALREAVTNIVRHAGAERCTIGVVTTGNDVRLTVADDGRGSAAPDGSGLAGMRERISALGGAVERRMDGGTTLTVTVPAQGVA